MPNWCYNHVEFKGERVKEVQELLKAGEAHNESTRNGWLPEFLLNDDHKYLFYISNISELRDGSLAFSCETKWTPAISVFEELCKRFDLSAEVEYSEDGLGVFGRYFYNEGVALDFYLDGKELAEVDYDCDTDSYIYQGKKVNSDVEIYDKMLDDKIKRYYAETFDSRLPDNSGGHDPK